MSTDSITEQNATVRAEHPHSCSVLIDAWEEHDRLQHQHDTLRVALAALIRAHRRDGSVPVADLQAALIQAQSTQ